MASVRRKDTSPEIAVRRILDEIRINIDTNVQGLPGTPDIVALDSNTPIGKLRGRLHDYRGIKLVATYHPAYLLRNPSAKRMVWEDMQIVMKELGIPVPRKKKP